MRKSIRISIILIVVIFIVFFRLAEKIDPDRAPDDRFRVTKIVDGDTAELAGGDKVRLIGIDTPEKGEPFYDSAKTILGKLIGGKKVDIQYSKRRRDNHGRLLGYLFVDSIFVNRLLIREGLATVYPFKDNLDDIELMDQLFFAQDSAILSQRGIWSLERAEEDYYYVTPNGLRFHRPQCRSLSANNFGKYRKFESRIEALRARYSPCRNCKP